MSASANVVILMGNLTRDPELRYTPQGRAVTTLNLAVNRVYKDKDTGKQVKNTDYIPISVWGTQAENCEKYLSKGRGVYVEGRLALNKWEDANGEPRSKLEIIARNVQFLSAGASAAKNERADKAAAVTDMDTSIPAEDEIVGANPDLDDEEIPF
ncbi:MAG: single-stranded DNA-binding protein [Elusimicrobiota bacterium]